jgi:hypothetical protein
MQSLGAIIILLLLAAGGSWQTYQVIRAIVSGKIRWFNRDRQFVDSSWTGFYTRKTEPGWFWFQVAINILLALLLLGIIVYCIYKKISSHETSS